MPVDTIRCVVMLTVLWKPAARSLRLINGPVVRRNRSRKRRVVRPSATAFGRISQSLARVIVMGIDIVGLVGRSAGQIAMRTLTDGGRSGHRPLAVMTSL